jgi:hypothetical protein
VLGVVCLQADFELATHAVWREDGADGEQDAAWRGVGVGSGRVGEAWMGTRSGVGSRESGVGSRAGVA